jgi:hypothetical protein
MKPVNISIKGIIFLYFIAKKFPKALPNINVNKTIKCNEYISPDIFEIYLRDKGS